MGGDIFCNSEVGKGSEFSFVVNLPPTTKQSYREAREVDEGSSARSRNVHQHQHNHRNHRHFRDQNSAAQSEDEENEEMIKLESDVDESTKQEKQSQSESSSTDSDSDSDSSDDSSEKDTESDLEDNHNGPAKEHFMTKSLTLTPVRRRTMPNLFGDGDQKQATDRNRKSIHGRGAIIASADRHLHQSIARTKSQHRRRSEGGAYLLHANPLGSSGRGYSAESETDHDDAEAWFSSDLSSSNSASSSLSLSRVSLTSPSSSFYSFSDTPLSTPSGQSSETLDISNDVLKSSGVPTYLGSIMAHNIDSQRRSSAPSLESVASRTRKKSQQHSSMPTIPSLQSASTSPLNSPTLHPLPSGYQGTPPSSPMFQASPTVVSSSITTLASSTHLVSLNSCSSPRGVVRKRTVTPPSYLRHTEQSATASNSSASRPVPPLNLAKISGSPRGASNRASTSPRSFYVPSFPLVSPRSVEHLRTPTSGPYSGTGDERKEILRGKSILIVEDNIINQKVALKMLSTFECKVRSCLLLKFAI